MAWPNWTDRVISPFVAGQIFAAEDATAPASVTEAQQETGTVAADIDLEVTSYMLAEMAAKRGRKDFDKVLQHVSILTKEEINEFMPELLGISAAADEASGEL